MTENHLDKNKLLSEIEFGQKELLKSVVLNVTDSVISRHIARISSFHTHLITFLSSREFSIYC